MYYDASAALISRIREIVHAGHGMDRSREIIRNVVPVFGSERAGGSARKIHHAECIMCYARVFFELHVEDIENFVGSIIDVAEDRLPVTLNALVVVIIRSVEGIHWPVSIEIYMSATVLMILRVTNVLAPHTFELDTAPCAPIFHVRHVIRHDEATHHPTSNC